MELIPLTALSDRSILSVTQAVADKKIIPKPAGVLTLPWPDKTLSPNARIHWAKRARASKAARECAFTLARQQGWNREWLQAIEPHSIDYLTRRYTLYLDFYPPDKRQRDDDNLIAAFKPYRDGLAQALGVDDARFRCSANIHYERVFPRGKVLAHLVTIAPTAD